jgi:hypothetical protein
VRSGGHVDASAASVVNIIPSTPDANNAPVTIADLRPMLPSSSRMKSVTFLFSFMAYSPPFLQNQIALPPNSAKQRVIDFTSFPTLTSNEPAALPANKTPAFSIPG